VSSAEWGQTIKG